MISKTQAEIKVTLRYMRDTAWAKRTILLPGYNMHSEEGGTYFSEPMGVMKASNPLELGPCSVLAHVPWVYEKEYVQQHDI